MLARSAGLCVVCGVLIAFEWRSQIWVRYALSSDELAYSNYIAFSISVAEGNSCTHRHVSLRIHSDLHKSATQALWRLSLMALFAHGPLVLCVV